MNSNRPQSFWSRPVVTWAATVFLGALFVLAFLTYLAADLVSNKLIDPQLYTGALEENFIYNRVYTELLADPALEEATTQLLGNVNLESLGPGVYSLAVSTLYLILPPDTLQTATEKVIVDVTSYLKGETDRLEPRLDLSSRLEEEALRDRTTDVLQVLLTELIVSSVPTGGDAGSDLDLQALAAYAQDLNQGELGDIPSSALATSLERLSDAERTRVADALLGPVEGEVDPLTRLGVEAALAADDLPSALAIASRALLADQVTGAVAQLADEFKNSETFDPLAATAIYLEETEAEVIARLNTVRDLVSLLDRRLIPLSILVAAISLALIVWIHSDSILELLRSAGVTFLVAGGLALILWFVLGLYLRSWMPELFGGSQAAVPAPLENMIRDVVASLTREIWSSVWTGALVAAAGGLLLIGLSYLPNVAARFERLLRPVWPYRVAILVGLAVLIVVVPALVRMLFGVPREGPQPCNGYVELCDRPLNEVAFAATHNGMSIADYSWLWPSHDGDISFQLNSGIRALLIDTHYYDAVASLSSYFKDQPPEVQAVAEKAVNLVGFESREGTYLCHIMCQLGWTPLSDTLEEIRQFLESHPREVVVLIIEDKITVHDTEETFEASGLLPYVYTHQAGQPWPTLGEMIDNGQRLVVMAEEEGPPPTWYHHVWDYTEETPYSVSSPEEFDCQPNRGGTDKPLFLLNHWIERVSPSRVDARWVNDYQFLLDRAQECAKERGQIPNFVAVNFYLVGNVVDVVAELNGVRDSRQP